MSILNPKDDVKALEPLVDRIIDKSTAALRSLIPDLQKAVQGSLEGLTITITISRKEQ